MTACTAIMECRHKIAFVSTLPIEKLLPWFPVCAFHFFPLFPFEFWFILLSFFIFLFSAFIQGWVLAAATNRWLQPLLLRTTWSADRGKKKMQAVNELPSFPSVGCLQIRPFCQGSPLLSLSCSPLACSCRHFLSSSLRPPLHHALPPALQFSLSTCLLHAPVAQWREQRCLALALSSIYCQRGSCLELAI